jgi:hypothetical protein
MDAYVSRESLDRELRRRQLAKRLVIHHARTQTIFRLTGLSRHQLATLRERWRITADMRHRGPSPNSFSGFFSNQRARDESAALAVFWRILGGVEADESSEQITMVEMGERICDVIEAFVACFPATALELEHVTLLARGIEEGDAIRLATCANCEALILADLLGTRRRLCSHCQRSEAAGNLPEAGGAEASGTITPMDTGEAVQQELF